MKHTPKINILVVDDHFVVRAGLSSSLGAEPDLAVKAEASTGRQALELYREHRPDVALIDLRMPDMSGIEITRAIRQEFPAARVIILSTHDGVEEIYRALQAGAASYLLKSAQREELLRAIRTVHGGERYMATGIALKIAERISYVDLSAREMDVLHAIASGKSNKEIASSLGIAEVTVKLHVRSILSKLQVNDRTQAVTAALQRGIMHLP
jgi:DNA-binding NarL/FixJ family response regulator